MKRSHQLWLFIYVVGVMLLLAPVFARADTADATVFVDGVEVEGIKSIVVHVATESDPPPGELPPVANAGGPYVGTVGSPVRFYGLASDDPDGSITRYVWSFGDGSVGAGSSPSHTYTTAGTFTVNLTVTDNDGLTDSDMTAAVIAPVDPPDPPGGCGPIPPNGKIESWASRPLFQVPFPGPKNKQVTIDIPGDYFAIKLNTRNTVDSGGIWNFEATGVPGGREMTLSRCPGEFVDVPDNCFKVIVASQRGIAWSTISADGGYCLLDKNTDYYWNVRFWPRCTGTYCRTNVRVYNRDY